MTPRMQRGAALVISLIMLVLVTLIVVSTFNVSDSNLKIVANMQYQREADSSAIQALNQIVGSTNFFTAPTSVTGTPITVDINGDGKTDYSVTMNATCLRATNIPKSTLDTSSADDRPCFGSSTAQNTGIVIAGGGSSNSGKSLCANSDWDISASATDPVLGTGVTSEIHQGVGVRMSQSDADNNATCN